MPRVINGLGIAIISKMCIRDRRTITSGRATSSMVYSHHAQVSNSIAKACLLYTSGKVKRGNREIIVTSKTGEVKKYLVPLSKQVLVQENDYVRAGTPSVPERKVRWKLRS